MSSLLSSGVSWSGLQEWPRTLPSAGQSCSWRTTFDLLQSCGPRKRFFLPQRAEDHRFGTGGSQVVTAANAKKERWWQKASPSQLRSFLQTDALKARTDFTSCLCCFLTLNEKHECINPLTDHRSHHKLLYVVVDAALSNVWTRTKMISYSYCLLQRLSLL